MNTDTPTTDQWETYCDECYYHMWRLRRKTERGWHDGFHINKGDEAKGLCDLLNNLERELAEARGELAGIENKMRVELGGHPDSELWGEAGLIAATMRCVDALGEVTDQRDEARDAAKKAKAYKRVLKETNAQLKRELDEWKAKYIQQNKDLGCELRDPNGTIWDHAKTLQRERDEARAEMIRWMSIAEGRGRTDETLSNQ